MQLSAAPEGDFNDTEANVTKYKGFRPKRKYPGFRKNIRNYITQYTENTGIHGFKYMGEPDRSFFERFFWTVLFCISLYFCINLITEAWMKWETSPVLVSFARSPTPVWEIPFPAITICPETKIKSTLYNFTDTYHRYMNFPDDMTQEEIDRFEETALICDNHLYNGGNKTVEYDAITRFTNFAPQAEEVLFSCKFSFMNASCSDLFVPVLTEGGLCFSFNMLDRRELFRKKVFFHENHMYGEQEVSGNWNIETGYPDNADKDTFPRRAVSVGFNAGLILVLSNYVEDIDYICKGPVQGHRILLHHPAQVPQITSHYIRVPLNQEVVVSVKPDMMSTSEGLRDYDPHRRECYFQDERYLSFYQNYTQENCQVECLTNFTLQNCGCVAYYMPRDESTPICGSGSLICMFQSQIAVLEREVKVGLSNTHTTNQSCDCLPACTSLTYNAETSQAQFNWPELFNAYNVDLDEFKGLQLSRVTISFKDQQFIKSERNELYGKTDFLANCGGILGLFTGFSFLSIVEIIYFLSLRLMCNVKKYGRHFWSGSKDLTDDNSQLELKIY